MKDFEVPTRKGISVFVKRTSTLEFTKREHLRIQTIRREQDGTYVPLDKKALELGKARECSSATFAVITQWRPHNLVQEFIDYLISKKGFQEVEIMTKYQGKQINRSMRAYAPKDADLDMFGDRVIVEFRRYVPDPKNANRAVYDEARSVNIAGIPLSRSVSSLTQGFFYSLGFEKKFKKYAKK